MRVTTAAILSLIALTAPGFTKKASANLDTQPFLQEQYRRDFTNPADSGIVASPEANSQDMFNRPFYAGEQPQVKREKTIAQGADGPEVAAIQQRLQAHGFEVGKIDGTYGSRTATAVSSFQNSKGLAETGAVNKETWMALAAEPAGSSETVESNAPTENITENSNAVTTRPATTLSKGSSGSKVKTLQVRLDLQGYDPGPIDGIFGARTAAAVKSFQESKDLKADGEVDEITWKALGQS
ncbi:MAG: peptidoglycan-binding protein [Oscillatoriaceae cyanobacterium Prado104]|jgi:peptidoglycan hydrolase-like protein with peptidoglycan-binding domain|nr:peptidoglycan-binding protein [Oscillatoriaceae cyanobacterium Prado104]